MGAGRFDSLDVDRVASELDVRGGVGISWGQTQTAFVCGDSGPDSALFEISVAEIEVEWGALCPSVEGGAIRLFRFFVVAFGV